MKRRRNRLGLTQIELADEAGIHPNVIGRLERELTTLLSFCFASPPPLETTLADLTRRALKDIG